MKVEPLIREFHDLHTALNLSNELVGNLTRISNIISSSSRTSLFSFFFLANESDISLSIDLIFDRVN